VRSHKFKLGRRRRRRKRRRRKKKKKLHELPAPSL
jgi:hypothetical protein